MKKFQLYFLAFVSIALISSCGASKNSISKKDIKGTWTLNDVRVSGLDRNDVVKIQLFRDADINCFKGSTWVLPNNNYGSYTINGGTGCTTGSRNIVWSYEQQNGETVFQFKRLQEGVKAKNIGEGYLFKIISVTAEAMQLQTQVSFENKMLTLDYMFSAK